MSKSSQVYEYSLKIINPKKKSDFVVSRLSSKIRFEALEDLKKQVLEEFNQQVQDPIKQIGYIEPGHGLRGKVRWLSSNVDLQEMYKTCMGKRELVLWTYAIEESDRAGKKRVNSESDINENPPKRSRYGDHIDKMAEVDKIHEELQEIHGNEYSDEQLRSWAHLVQMKKHDSLEVAPDKPFWRNKKKSISSSTGAVVSPSKRISLRGQCVEQLQKWHVLLESGGIDKVQYDEFKATIMSDIKKF